MEETLDLRAIGEQFLSIWGLRMGQIAQNQGIP